MAASQAIAGLIFRLMTCSLIVASLFLNPANAAEPEQVSIQTLLSPQATSYQEHLVTLEGVTSALQILPPTVGGRKCHTLYGQATFVLEDETGSLMIEVLGGCKPGAVEILPQNRDRVRVTGLVHVRNADTPRDVRVQATQIQILATH